MSEHWNVQVMVQRVETTGGFKANSHGRATEVPTERIITEVANIKVTAVDQYEAMRKAHALLWAAAGEEPGVYK